MARNRFRRIGRRVRSGFRKAHMFAKKGGSSSIYSRLETAGFGFGYGAIRQSAHDQLTKVVPIDWELKEEAVAGLIGFLAGGSKNKWVRKAGDTILTVESASVGHQVVGQKLANKISSSSSTGSVF